ncbi:MAG: CPBP family glutamic-type intramembrane protease [Planctomycetota bacterium]|nr:CPBP family glutamic-type intramembrane protease [Planctomycetota bacterium]
MAARGVYEELVFRVLLLQLLMLAFTKLLKLEKAYAAAWAVGLGALIFSAFHYIGSEGDRLELNSFIQRTFAGVFFAAVYVTRSFGVAAAAHAEYDIAIGLTHLFASRA